MGGLSRHRLRIDLVEGFQVGVVGAEADGIDEACVLSGLERRAEKHHFVGAAVVGEAVTRGNEAVAFVEGAALDSLLLVRRRVVDGLDVQRDRMVEVAFFERFEHAPADAAPAHGGVDCDVVDVERRAFGAVAHESREIPFVAQRRRKRG